MNDQRGWVPQDIVTRFVPVTHPPLPLDFCGVKEVWVGMVTEETNPRLFAKFLLLQAYCTVALPSPTHSQRHVL